VKDRGSGGPQVCAPTPQNPLLGEKGHPVVDPALQAVDRGPEISRSGATPALSAIRPKGVGRNELWDYRLRSPVPPGTKPVRALALGVGTDLRGSVAPR
jgi:hypothetical protein